MGEGEISPAHSLFSAGRAAYMAKRARNTVLDGVQAVLLPLYTFRFRSRKRR
jgi:hypothetical protein